MLDAWKQDFKVTSEGKLLRVAIKGRAISPREVGSKDGKGYLQCSFRSKQYRVHRIIFALTHGYLPGTVDHIDGNTLNNHPANLREVTASQNSMNAATREGTSTGVKGVFFHKGKGKFIPHITINYKRKWLGHFTNLEDAIKARDEAAELHHGSFQRGGGGLSGH